MDIFTSVLAGGATGLFGTIFTGGFRLFQKHREHKHELAMRREDRAADEAEAAAAERREAIKAEADITVSQNETQAATLLGSYEMDQATYSDNAPLTTGQQWLMAIVDFVRGMMRPSMTAYLLIITSIIAITGLFGLTGNALLPPDQTAVTMAAAAEAVSAIVYLTNVAVTWWFGDKAIRKVEGDK